MKTNARRIPGKESVNRVAAYAVAAISLLLSTGGFCSDWDWVRLGLPMRDCSREWTRDYGKLSCDFNGERKELRKLCDEFDSYGGQPVIEGKVKEEVDKWVIANISQMPSKYLVKIPKTNLQQDKFKKARQDRVMKQIKLILDNLQYAYGQSLALGLPLEKFSDVSKKYKAICASKWWHTLGDREPKRCYEARDMLFKMSDELHSITVDIYKDLMTAKQKAFTDYAIRNPAVVQQVQMIKMKKQVAAAEARAEEAERHAAYAESDAANAYREAAEANARAEDAAIRANRAERRLFDNGSW